MNKYNYQFIGKLNAVKRYDLLHFIIFAGIILFFLALGFGKVYAAAAMFLIVSSIIVVLFMVDLTDNTLLFDKEKIIHIRKSKIENEYAYDEIDSNNFMYHQRYQSYVLMRIKNRKLKYKLEAKSGMDCNKEEFIAFLLSKKNSMEILEFQTDFQKYKYFLLNDSVKKIEVD